MVQFKLQFNMKWILATAGAIAAAWLVLFAFTASATSTSDKLKDVKENIEQSKDKLEQSKQDVAEMETSMAQLEGKLAELNKELASVSAQLEGAQLELADKRQALEETRQQLSVAEANEAVQYDSMKKRIKYMYENNTNSDMLQLILEGNNFTDMLNKADFFRQMAEYDRNMLDEYSATKETIANAKAALEQEEKELETAVAQVEQKQKEVNHLVSQTSKEIAKQEETLADAEAKALAYEKQLQDQQSSLKLLQEKEAEEKRILAEQEKLKKAALAKQGAGVNTSLNNNSNSGVSNNAAGSQGGSGSSSGGYNEASNTSELKLLATIIYCEAGNQPYEGKIAVGSVVMNRIRSSLFPNTMLAVLYQKSQFTPVMSGRFAVALAKDSASESCYAAAREVLGGANNVPDCLFFRTVIPGRDGIIIGNHVFY